MSSRAFSVSYPRRTADSKLARTTWPEVLRPRAIMRPRDWARQRALLRILRKSFFHTNWNFISLEYFFDFSASFMANFPNFQLFKRFRYTFLTLKVVCSWGRGLLSLASGVKRWLRRQYFRISQPGLRWVPYISFCRGGSRIFFRRGCTLLLLYFNTNKPHSFFFFCRIPVVLENRRSSLKPRKFLRRFRCHHSFFLFLKRVALMTDRIKIQVRSKIPWRHRFNRNLQQFPHFHFCYFFLE